MARISECVKAEAETPARVMRLVNASNGFLRAYNRSAWKFQTFVADYKARRNYVKNIEQEVVVVGFPEGMLHKLAEGRALTATEWGYDLELRPDEQLADDSAYEQWRSALPLGTGTKSDFDQLPLGGLDAEKDVLRRLRLFPLERKTPIECQNFLAELRATLDPQT